MKIWFQTFEWPPDFGGGLSTYMENTVRMLSEGGHEVTVIYSNPSASERYISNEAPNVTVVHFPTGRDEQYKNTPHWVNLSRLFAETTEWAITQLGKPDIIEVADGFGIGYFTLLKREAANIRLKGIPIICTAHTPVYLMNRANKKSEYLIQEAAVFEMEKGCYELCDLISVPSNYLRKLLIEDLPRIAESKYNLVRLPYYHNPQLSLNTISPKENPSHLYMASRVEYWKGAVHLAHEMKKLWDQGSHIHLHYYGDDTYMDYEGLYTSERIKELLSDEFDAGLIKFHGRLPRAQIEKDNINALAQVHPSIQENYPYAVTENMFAGRITIASTSGGQGEMIQDGESGFLFNHDEEGSFEGALNRCKNLTKKKRLTVQKNALKRINELSSPDSILPLKIQEYESCIPQTKKIEKSPDVDNIVLSVVLTETELEGELDSCVRSIAKSTHKNVELIVGGPQSFITRAVDALNTQGLKPSNTIIASSYTEIKNEAILKASGTYICYLNKNTQIGETYFKHGIKLLEHIPNLGYATSWILINDAEFNSTRSYITGHHENTYNFLHPNFTYETAIFKVETLKKNNFNKKYTGPLREWDHHIRVMLAEVKGGLIPENLQYRVSHPAGKYEWHRKQVDLETIVREYGAKLPEKVQRLLLYSTLNSNFSCWYLPSYHAETSFKEQPQQELSAIKRKTSKLFDRYPTLRKIHRYGKRTLKK